MSILVDDLTYYAEKPFGSFYWCHMMSDDTTSAGLDDLHAFARKVGLPRRYFQDHPAHPHYDLYPSKRELAIRYGAEPVSSEELIRRCSLVVRRAHDLTGSPRGDEAAPTGTASRDEAQRPSQLLLDL